MEQGRAMDGTAHLAVLAREPRPAGGEAEQRARGYAARVLGDAGFQVECERFVYSAFPGRLATPIGGALAGATVCLGASLALMSKNGAGALVALLAGLLLLMVFTATMLGVAVLRLPFMRAESQNLVATRGSEAPRVWLVAHLDSKSQPVPSLARVSGVVLVAGALALALVACGLQLASLPHRTAWWGAIAATILGAPLLMLSVVGARSPGALDNASGVAAVLAAATALDPWVSVGVLLPSAEELGLAGARAWARERAAGTALNCDGVDDDGELTIMYTRTRPNELIDVVRRAAPHGLGSGSGLRARRMPLGLLTDSVALADRGWSTVTLSRGSLASLRRVHTSHDSLAALRGDGVDVMATLLARAAEALA